MKKLSTCLLVFLMVCLGNSQVKVGVKAGVNISNLSGDVESTKSKTGFYIGEFTQIFLSSKFSFQPEIQFSTQGATETTTYNEFVNNSLVTKTSKTKYKLNYLTVPLMFQYEVINHLRIEAGPQFGMLLSKDSFEISPLNMGFNIGAGYELQNGFSISTRYNFDLFVFGDWGNIKNRVFSVGVGYAL